MPVVVEVEVGIFTSLIVLDAYTSPFFDTVLHPSVLLCAKDKVGTAWLDEDG